jgi:bifunctional UDP-N-acetylglucosamine pyrophosphorylase/glucosamine-1-phosphate N-acetyltransferase
MKSALPKPLHPLCGLPLTRHVIRVCREVGIERIVVVIGHEADKVRQGLGSDVEYAVQEQQLGTGHAAMCARSVLADFNGNLLVLAGDVPLLRAETLRSLMDALDTKCSAAMLTATLDDPTGYGRVIRKEDGSVSRIVEQRDATPEEAAIKEWNPSIYCFRSEQLFDRLARVKADNAQGEQYLTDVIGLATADGDRIAAVPVADAREVLGVNTRVELAEVAAIMRARILRDLMLSGVTVVDPRSTYVDVTVTVGRDTTLEPQTHLVGDCTVGEGCVIGPMTVLQDVTVGDRSAVVQSRVCGSVIGSDVRVGPFANVRPGSRIHDGARIGDFVEIKNAEIGEGVAASHLSYIGDADVGAHTNIGAGTITCNYDGYHKHRTVIGERAFIGSHSTLVAPVEVGAGAMTAAGSVITDDVPPDALAIARQRQCTREGWSRRWRAAHEKRVGEAKPLEGNTGGEKSE